MPIGLPILSPQTISAAKSEFVSQPRLVGIAFGIALRSVPPWWRRGRVFKDAITGFPEGVSHLIVGQVVQRLLRKVSVLPIVSGQLVPTICQQLLEAAPVPSLLTL